MVLRVIQVKIGSLTGWKQPAVIMQSFSLDIKSCWFKGAHTKVSRNVMFNSGSNKGFWILNIPYDPYVVPVSCRSKGRPNKYLTPKSSARSFAIAIADSWGVPQPFTMAKPRFWQKAIRSLPGVSELRLCLSGGREPRSLSQLAFMLLSMALWKSVQISPESQGRTTFWQAKPLFLTSSPHASSGHLCGSVLSTHGSSPHRRCSEARPPLLEIAKEIFTPESWLELVVL